MPFGDEYWKKVDELTNKYIDEAYSKIDADLAKAKDFKNTRDYQLQEHRHSRSSQGPDTSTATASVASLKSLQEQRTSLMREQGVLETQLLEHSGEESRKALEGQITNPEAPPRDERR